MMSNRDCIVYVVDDDAPVRDSMTSLFRSVGLCAEAFGSAEEFLSASRREIPSCLVLDVRLPGMTGLELQGELARAGIGIPIVFVTGHGDIPMVSRAMKAGAVEFLTKPFQKQELLAAIRQALDRDRARREQEAKLSVLRSRFGKLTSRQREVLHFVVGGFTNKEIAAKLGLSEITIKVHRSQMMQNMGADTLAGLVQLAGKLGMHSHR
ncbi:MAG: response regulator [Acidobacteriia bacterium]|nr:response regulator [Terriglobia bacterium]